VSSAPSRESWASGDEGAAAAGAGGGSSNAALGSGHDAERRPSPAAARARRWREERGAAPGSSASGRRAIERAPRGRRAAAKPEGDVTDMDIADGGGAFTCDPYTPGVDALPANATLIRRLDLAGPKRLPGSFTSVAQPSVGDVIAFLAASFNITAASLRPASKGPPADATDALGMRHIRLEQVEQYMGDWYGVEFGSLAVHLRPGPGGSPEAYLVTGGYIDDVAARIGAGSRKVRLPESQSAGGDGGSPSRGTVDAETAASISLDAALNGRGGATARRGGAAARRGGGASNAAGATRRRAYLSRAAALRAGSTARSAAAGGDEEGPDELAGARGAPERVIYCALDGGCYPVWRQPVFVPAAYMSDAAPQELHVYVSATDGTVLARHDRLRTWAGSAPAAQAAEAAPAPPAARRLRQAQPSVPQLLPASAYVRPRSDTPEGRAAAEAINAALAAKYDGPSMRATQGVGATLYSGTVPLDTAEVTRLTRRGTKVSDGFVLTDMKRLGQKTYDLRGQLEPNKDASIQGQDIKDRSNVW
jgi:hypothetical protein